LGVKVFFSLHCFKAANLCGTLKTSGTKTSLSEPVFRIRIRPDLKLFGLKDPDPDPDQDQDQDPDPAPNPDPDPPLLQTILKNMF